MDYDRIIGLLDKYWKCETTLPEEEELRYFYKHCRQMPEELAEYRELFIFQEGERQIGLGNDFDRKILASIYNKRPAGWRKGLRVAAVLLLLIGGKPGIDRYRESAKGYLSDSRTGTGRSPAGFEFCIFEDEQRTTTVGREYGRNEMDKPIYKINR